MNIFKNLKGHFCTITHHKMLVMKTCFKVGLYKQGLLHDLSKYTPIEFVPGIIYYQGDRSPINREKELKNCSRGWLHHKGRNLHHFEYWIIDDEADYLARYLLTMLDMRGEEYLLHYMKHTLLRHKNRDYHVRDGRLYLD